MAVANLGLDGGIDDVVVVNREHRPVEMVHVEPDSGLWAAMEVWIKEPRETWPGD